MNKRERIEKAILMYLMYEGAIKDALKSERANRESDFNVRGRY